MHDCLLDNYLQKGKMMMLLLLLLVARLGELFPYLPPPRYPRPLPRVRTKAEIPRDIGNLPRSVCTSRAGILFALAPTTQATAQATAVLSQNEAALSRAM